MVMVPHSDLRALELEPGDIIADRYCVQRTIGQGGEAVLYAAKDLMRRVQVALKYPLVQSDENIRRLRHEQGVGCFFVQHPNVCQMIDVKSYAGLTFGIMRYVEGESLRSILSRRQRLSRRRTERFAIELCGGLNHLHLANLVHRDLKPENIMIDEGGGVKIIDLGVAVEQGLGRDEIAGTYEYMAPEQTRGVPAKSSADIYALGLVLYEAVTGVQCLQRDPDADADPLIPSSERLRRHLEAIRRCHGALKRRPSELHTELDASVDDLIMRCLNPDPRYRPDASALRELWKALASV